MFFPGLSRNNCCTSLYKVKADSIGLIDIYCGTIAIGLVNIIQMQYKKKKKILVMRTIGIYYLNNFPIYHIAV